MKKLLPITACLLAVLALVFCLTACSNETEEPALDTPNTVEQVEVPVEEETPVEEEAPVEEEVPAETTAGIRPEFKEAMDSYEAFYNEYCEFMKKYKANPTDLTLLGEYAGMMTKSTEMTQKFEAWNEADMNDAELTYYLEVNNRVAQKLLECTQ